MPIIQVRNPEAQLLGSTDHLFIGDRNFPIEVYNTAAETFTAETTLGLNTVRLNPAPEIYSLAANILTVKIPGYYLFTFRTSLSMTGGVAGQAIVYLKQDPATGVFATVPVTSSYVYLPAGLNQSIQLTVPLLVGANYRYLVAGIRASGSGSVGSLNNSTALAVLRLYQNGSYAPDA